MTLLHPRASVVSFSGFRLDMDTCELSKNGRPLRMRQQPARVLALLVRHWGEIVSRDEFRNQIWGEETFVDFEHGLNNCIKEIRSTLGDSPSKPRYIETVPKRGYRFIVPLENLEEPAVEPVASLPPATGTAFDKSGLAAQTARRPGLVTIFGLLALLVVGGYVAQRLVRKPAHASPTRVMVAVLPFQNLTGNPSEEFISDGFTEEMISQLGRLNGEQLGVIARTSSMTYKGSSKQVSEIARELGVNYVLEGSVRSAPESLHITVQFIRAEDQTHLWAGEYDRPVSDLVKLQAEVASTIAREIQIRVTPQAQLGLAGTRSVNPEAYRSYLLGRYDWNKRSGANLTKALESFERSIQQDPGYAPAYAGLADTYSALIFYGYIPGRKGIPKAKAMATKAVELGPTLAEAHASRGYVYFMWEHDWQNAEQEFKRAIELDGNYSSAHHWYALYLGALGRREESLSQIQQASELDPFALILTTASGYLAYFARHYEEAETKCEKVLQRDPEFMVAHAVLGLAHEGRGDYSRAVSEFKETLRISGGRSPGYLDFLGHAYAASGNRKEAEAILAELDKLGTSGAAGPSYRAATLLALKDRARALEAIEEGFENDDGELIWLKVDPRFDALHEDPRYLKLLQHAGLEFQGHAINNPGTSATRPTVH